MVNALLRAGAALDARTVDLILGFLPKLETVRARCVQALCVRVRVLTSWVPPPRRRRVSLNSMMSLPGWRSTDAFTFALLCGVRVRARGSGVCSCCGFHAAGRS